VHALIVGATHPGPSALDVWRQREPFAQSRSDSHRFVHCWKRQTSPASQSVAWVQPAVGAVAALSLLHDGSDIQSGTMTSADVSQKGANRMIEQRRTPRLGARGKPQAPGSASSPTGRLPLSVTGAMPSIRSDVRAVHPAARFACRLTCDLVASRRRRLVLVAAGAAAHAHDPDTKQRERPSYPTRMSHRFRLLRTEDDGMGARRARVRCSRRPGRDPLHAVPRTLPDRDPDARICASAPAITPRPRADSRRITLGPAVASVGPHDVESLSEGHRFTVVLRARCGRLREPRLPCARL
jgi:hypothetical protein